MRRRKGHDRLDIRKPGYERVIYLGQKFIKGVNGYFESTCKDDRRKLHQVIWDEYYPGTRKDGMHVHHKDGNKTNNDVTNLELLPGSKHARLHAPGVDAVMASKEWHGSPEGLEWHRLHGIDCWVGKTKSRQATCESCGRTYVEYPNLRPSRFCGNNCKSRWRRDSGVDDVDRKCARCGNGFKVNKYSRKTHCSRGCAVIASWERRKSRVKDGP